MPELSLKDAKYPETQAWWKAHPEWAKGLGDVSRVIYYGYLDDVPTTDTRELARRLGLDLGAVLDCLEQASRRREQAMTALPHQAPSKSFVTILPRTGLYTIALGQSSNPRGAKRFPGEMNDQAWLQRLANWLNREAVLG